MCIRDRSTTNTLGTKGVGEAGTIASTPAVVNAIVDAVRHLGVDDVQMPCTPERVWKAIRAGSASRSGQGPGDESGPGSRHESGHGSGHESRHGSEHGGASAEAQPHFAEDSRNQDPQAGAADGADQ